MSARGPQAGSASGLPDRRPHYHPRDSLHLLYRMHGMFYVQLSDGRLLKQLKELCSAGRAYGKFLARYTDVVCEPLDLFYVCRRASCTLDAELLQDLLFSFSWREAHWGAWLAALAPEPVYAQHILRSRPLLPYGQEITSLALAACGAADPPTEQAEPWSLLLELRSQLALLPRLTMPMRRSPTVDEEAALRVAQDKVREAYRRGGMLAGQQALNHTLLSHWLPGHVEWVRMTHE